MLPEISSWEFDYTENSFLNLLYPKPFLHFDKSKALKIYRRNRFQNATNTPSNKIKLHILPYNSTNFMENDSLSYVNLSWITTIYSHFNYLFRHILFFFQSHELNLPYI